MKRNWLLIVAGGLWALAAAVNAAPDAELWAYWQAHDESNPATIDHGAWGAFLDEYLVRGDDGINRLRYGDVSDADREALDQYIARLGEIAITGYRRDVQFAYWVNLYNALTVQVVLKHYPVESITDIDISPGWFSNGPWDQDLITVEGKDISLNDIEHRILRPIWQDARIHYAVNCASLGCPNLIAEPYTAEGLEACLDQRARAYINHPRGAHFEDGGLVVSSIYDWYQEDFGGSEAGVIAHLMQYAKPALRARLKGADGIDDYQYDWSLNDAANR